MDAAGAADLTGSALGFDSVVFDSVDFDSVDFDSAVVDSAAVAPFDEPSLLATAAPLESR
ncbi:MAG: hypothetical protein ACXWQR_16920 [Ktedonobacterales bacterium]